jgi:hypothetical protein
MKTKAVLQPKAFSDIVNMSDVDAGKFLLGFAVADKAEQLGIYLSDLSIELAAQITEHIQFSEALEIDSAGVEKAIKKAASGDFETAGRWIKQYLRSGAEARKFIPIGKKRLSQTRQFAQRGADTQKEKGKKTREKVLEAAKRILANRSRKPTDRELADLIDSETGIPSNTVRGHLTNLRKQKKLD